MSSEGDLLHVVTADNISERRRLFGKFVVRGSLGLLFLVALLQTADENGWVSIGFETWRPTLFAYVLWAVCLCAGQVIARGRTRETHALCLACDAFCCVDGDLSAAVRVGDRVFRLEPVVA